MQMITAQRKVTVIRPSGHFNASNAAELQEHLTAVVNQAERGSVLLVNLEQVESMDSAGLMTLVYGLRLAQSSQKRFSLCSVSPSIKIIFELTGLDSVFEIFDSPVAFEAAIA